MFNHISEAVDPVLLVLRFEKVAWARTPGVSAARWLPHLARLWPVPVSGSQAVEGQPRAQRPAAWVPVPDEAELALPALRRRGAAQVQGSSTLR
ncbi:MAG: hypothetical protein WCI95_06055 [bacterium]